MKFKDKVFSANKFCFKGGDVNHWIFKRLEYSRGKSFYSKYYWNAEERLLTSHEMYVIFNFKDVDNINFRITGDYSKIYCRNNCEIKITKPSKIFTGDNCKIDLDTYCGFSDDNIELISGNNCKLIVKHWDIIKEEHYLIPNQKLIIDIDYNTYYDNPIVDIKYKKSLKK